MTPSGTPTLRTCRPLGRTLLSRTRPTGSGRAAISRRPAAAARSRCGVSRRRSTWAAAELALGGGEVAGRWRRGSDRRVRPAERRCVPASGSSGCRWRWPAGGRRGGRGGQARSQSLRQVDGQRLRITDGLAHGVLVSRSPLIRARSAGSGVSRNVAGAGRGSGRAGSPWVIVSEAARRRKGRGRICGRSGRCRRRPGAARRRPGPTSRSVILPARSSSELRPQREVGRAEELDRHIGQLVDLLPGPEGQAGRDGRAAWCGPAGRRAPAPAAPAPPPRVLPETQLSAGGVRV